MTTPPNWAEIVTAVSTAFLVMGVGVAVLQLYLTRKQTSLLETRQLLEMLTHGLPEVNYRVEKFTNMDSYLYDSRRHTKQTYDRIKRLRGRKAFRKLWDTARGALQDISYLVDQVEIYIRKGNADEGTIAEHMGYYILATFFIVQDILRERALEEDMNYEGWYDLARRVQDYAKMHPLATELRDPLVWVQLPPIVYADGGQSHSYLEWWHVARKLRLWFAFTIRYPFPGVRAE